MSTKEIEIESLPEAIDRSQAIFEWLGAKEPKSLESALEIAHDMLEHFANKYGERNTVDVAIASVGLALATLKTLEEFKYR